MMLHRRVFRLVFLWLLAACTAGVAAPASDDPSALLRLLRDDVLREPLDGKQVYVSREPLPGGATVRTWRATYAVPSEFARAWFFFVDDAPQANWEHPARYVFVDADSRRHTVIQARTPPSDLAGMRRLYPPQ
jgi:hypothetical protein